MKTSSCKAKGRKACSETREALLRHAKSLHPDDIVVVPSGVTGRDLLLSPAAQLIYPFAIEVKNQESLNVWASFAQAETHVRPGETPVLFYKRNRSELMVSLKCEDFLQLLSIARDNSLNGRADGTAIPASSFLREASDHSGKEPVQEDGPGIRVVCK